MSIAQLRRTVVGLLAYTTMSDFTVTVGGSRGDEWERICGTRTFPVRSPIPVLADLPGKPSSRVFLLAIEDLDGEVREKIFAHLAQKFGLSPEEQMREINAQGIPILDEECSVMIRNPQRWI